MTETSQQRVDSAGLSVRGITRTFDEMTAVDNVSFDVAPGELVALVGASGSGKTTSLRIVAGYETPDAGTVLLDGEDVTRLGPERRGFGMVFQQYALFPHMSVAENVAFGLEARGVSAAERMRRATQALESVGLGGKGARRIQQLSGGEQQRVALARAVVIEPRVLLLDEPLSNLDPTLRESTRDELRAMLHRVGAPALFVTHDQEDAFAIADRMVLLSRGLVLQEGPPSELYHRPASRDVASFIGHATLVPARDEGNTATVTILGISQSFSVVRPSTNGAAESRERFSNPAAVFRPEALELTAPDAPDAWPGRVVSRRFVGATNVYRVALSDMIVVEVLASQLVAEESTVGVAVRRPPVPLVP